MTAVHTPGPWTWEIHDVSMASLCGPRGEEQNVLSVSPCKGCQEGHDQWKWGRCTTPSLADAHLLAAAPVMLAKLEQLAGECAGCDGTGEWHRVPNIAAPGCTVPCEDCKELREIIAAARGEA